MTSPPSPPGSSAESGAVTAVAGRPTATGAGGQSSTGRSSLLMLGSCAAFAGLMVIVRHISEQLDPLQITFFRNVFSVVFMLPWLVSAGLTPLRTQRFGLHMFRALTGLAAMATLFTALSLMPLAEATALTFTTPLFATLGAAIIFKEAVGRRRWTAMSIGFLGTLIVLRPGADAFTPAALIAIASAVFMATAMLAVKSLSRTERSITIVLYFNLLVTPISLVPALLVWETPAPEMWKWLIAVGLLAMVGQLFLTMALASADVSAILPIDFSQLVFVAVLGFLIFSEVPALTTWLGAAIIIASTAYIAERNAGRGAPPRPAVER